MSLPTQMTPAERLEETRLQAIRNRWDPWDPVVHIDRDGGYMRRKAGGLGRNHAAKTLQRLVESGELAKLPRATGTTGDVVYFIQRERGGPVKIGHTTQQRLDVRLRALQHAHDEPLVIRAVFAGGAWLEVALHELFANYRIRGEWFKATPYMQDVCAEVVVGA